MAPKRAAEDPLMGALAKVIKTDKNKDRVGEVIKHTPEDKTFEFKVKFDDKKDPSLDWFAGKDLHLRPTPAGMDELAAAMREKAESRMKELKKDIEENFQEYQQRLQAMTAGKAIMTAGKMLVSLVPGAGAVSHAADGATLAAEITHIVNECGHVALTMANMFDLYIFGNAGVKDDHAEIMKQLRSKEDRLIKVLTRHTKILGESTVVGTEATEPGARVLVDLLELRAISERLATLDELGLRPEMTIAAMSPAQDDAEKDKKKDDAEKDKKK